MSQATATEPTGPGRPRLMLKPLGPMALVVLSLLTLIALAISIDRQMRAMGQELTRIADPIRSAVRDVQVSLALETAGTRGYLLTGESGFVRGHQAARTNRKAAIARLEELAPMTAPQVGELIHTLAATLRPADALLDSLFEAQLTRDDYVLRLSAQQQRLETVTATASQLITEVNRRTVDRFGEIGRAQRRTLLVMAALAAITLGAVIQVTRLGFGYRALAVRANAAQAETEAAWREAERRRVESEQIAESRARLMRGFTHDVKNPLGAADGYLELLEDGAIDPQQAARDARRTVRSALSLIDDLLLLAHAESGEMIVRRAPFDLGEVARQAVEDCRVLAESKGLSVSADTPAALPLLVSDRDRVRQILENLVSNAVKYTEAGSVTLQVRRWTEPAASEAREWARVDVRDTGPGLMPGEHELAFHEFQRLGTSAGTRGTGLGLAISKRIAMALGGDTRVESEVGAGSTFTLLLPADWVEAHAPSTTPTDRRPRP
jgi:signal transduction histidine kinase